MTWLCGFVLVLPEKQEEKIRNEVSTKDPS